MIKNVFADRFLSFAFGKYCLFKYYLESIVCTQRTQNSFYVFGRSLGK